MQHLLTHLSAGSGDLGTNQSNIVSSLHARASLGTRDGVRRDIAGYFTDLIDTKLGGARATRSITKVDSDLL